MRAALKIVLAACVVPAMWSCMSCDIPNNEVEGAAAVIAEWDDLLAGGLAGWTTAGDPDAWAVEDGELFVAKPGQGRWLRTERTYRDFELTLDFWLPENGNSGVGLRGSATGDPAFTGFEVQILDTHAEEPKDTNCGAVYNAIAPKVMAVNPPGQWNTYRIRLIGDILDVWLNGRRLHEAERLDARGYVHQRSKPSPLEERLKTGYIALQDHGHAVRFRNIRVRDFSIDPDEGGYEPIFDGRDLTGWERFGTADWSVEEGVLVGRDGPGHLFTTERFSDVDIRAHVMINERGNSGLYFRVEPRPEDPHTWPLGYEAQVDNHDPKNFTGCVYDRAWPAVERPITTDGSWFDYRVLAVGDEIRTWINGRPMVSTTLDDFERGRIALQGHHEGNVVMYRDLRVRRLSEDAR